MTFIKSIFGALKKPQLVIDWRDNLNKAELVKAGTTKIGYGPRQPDYWVCLKPMCTKVSGGSFSKPWGDSLHTGFISHSPYARSKDGMDGHMLAHICHSAEAAAQMRV